MYRYWNLSSISLIAIRGWCDKVAIMIDTPVLIPEIGDIATVDSEIVTADKQCFSSNMPLNDWHQSLSSAIGDNKEQWSTSHAVPVSFSYSKDPSLACWKATSVSPSLKFRLVNFYDCLGSSEDNSNTYNFAYRNFINISIAYVQRIIWLDLYVGESDSWFRICW